MVVLTANLVPTASAFVGAYATTYCKNAWNI